MPLPKLPKPPRLSEFIQNNNPVHGVVQDARELIKGGQAEIHGLAESLRGEPIDNKASTPATPSLNWVSEADTYKYQCDLILDELQHLEVEHLPNKGRIFGKTCDCIAKASRSLRRLAKETIPIAARAGKNPKLFDEIASWADHMMAIGTAQAVESGEYDEVYLQEAGTASAFRKQIQKELEGCTHCNDLNDLKKFLELRGST